MPITTTCDYDGARVININLEKLIKDDDIQQFGQEILSYLTPGSGNYDPSVDYCINCDGVKFFSSTALGKLISIDKKHKKASKSNNPLSLAEIKPEVYEDFVITGLNRLFTIYDTVEDFLESRAT